MEQTPVHDHYNLELLNIIPADVTSVIEIGCSSGALAQAYKKLNPACHYTGIDISDDFLVGARSRCDVVECKDIEKMDGEFFDQYASTQCWIFGDVLEHLYDPWRVLSAISSAMQGEHFVAACIPNAQHWSLILKLLTGDFRYQDAGLLDRTHIRWFTKQTIIDLFESTGFEILDIKARVLNESSRDDFVPLMAELAGMAGRDQMDVAAEVIPYQYVVLCKKRKRVISSTGGASHSVSEEVPLDQEFFSSSSVSPSVGASGYLPPYSTAKYFNGAARVFSKLPVVRKIKPLLDNLNYSFCFISATRKKASEFWGGSPLGVSLSKLMEKNERVKSYVAYENSVGLSCVYNTVVRNLDDRCICVFVHDDVWLIDEFLLEKILRALGGNDIVGLAGNRRRVDFQPAWIFSHREGSLFIEDFQNLSGRVAHGSPEAFGVTTYGTTPACCQILDGVFLAVKAKKLKRSRVYFDERFDFHFYDIDFCRSAAKAGLRMTTWPIDIIHESEGGFGSDAWELGYQKYLEKWKN